MPTEPTLSFSAGVELRCDDCGQPMMAGLVDSGPVLVHALPVCEAFTEKALGEAGRWARRLLENPPAQEAK